MSERTILLVGPGKSTRNITGGEFDPKQCIVVDSDPLACDWWKEQGAEPFNKSIIDELNSPLHWYIRHGSIAEVHGYEVFNLLPGDAKGFFDLWKSLWLVMKPGAKVYSTVPHWLSQWAHAYPEPQRTYTPGLLSYLDHNDQTAHKSDFYTLWPDPYNFKLVTSMSMYRADDPTTPQGYYFVLEKN